MVDLKRAFLADIIENPDDDTPRLIYADWLEETGGEKEQTRAEFIRVQIALARMENGPDDEDERLRLKTRESLLLGLHLGNWLAEVPRVGSDARFRRGFIEQITLSEEALIDHWYDLFRAAPIRNLILDEVPRLDRLCDLPICTVLESITLRCHRALPLNLSTFFQHSFPRLRALVLRSFEATGQHLQALGNARFAPQLHSLELTGAGLSGADLWRILQRKRFHQLTTLILNHNPLGDEGVARLIDSGILFGLNHLDLSYAQLTPRSGVLLGNASRMDSLTRLDLHFNELHEQGAAALARSASFPQLTDLDIGFNEIGDEGARAFAEPSCWFPKLQKLSLSHSFLEDETISIFAQSQLLRQLRHLELDFNRLHGTGVVTLAASPNAGQLRHLNLAHNALQPFAIRALANSQQLSQLRHLSLSRNSISAEGFRGLIEGVGLANLENLIVSSAEPNAETCRQLETRFGSRLRYGG
jgi:uncharacterized protein (TIGR02996 family)